MASVPAVEEAHTVMKENSDVPNDRSGHDGVVQDGLVNNGEVLAGTSHLTLVMCSHVQ